MKMTLLVSLFFCGFHANGQETIDSVFTEADQMPLFYGCASSEPDSISRRRCSDRALVRFINRQLEYPEAARDSGIYGTVYVSFIIDERGKVLQAEILKDIGAGCGEAALELVQRMPPWQPAFYQGKKVKMRMNLPIQFNLKASDGDMAQAFTISWGSLSGAEISRNKLLENISQPVLVRNIKGEIRPVDELIVNYERRNRQLEVRSRGTINREIEKLLKKVKSDGILTLIASVQQEGRFIQVSRSIQIVK